jgi:Glycosyl hydrolase 108
VIATKSKNRFIVHISEDLEDTTEMARFEDAIGLTLQHEGEFVNDPADPGGATNFGIEQRDMPGVDIRSISKQMAVPITAPAALAPELANDVLHQRYAKDFLAMMCLAPGVVLTWTAAGPRCDSPFKRTAE